MKRDRDKAAAIWKSTDNVWWPGGPDDRNVRVLRLDPLIAELWDGPASSTVAAFEFAKARLPGQKPNLGEKRKKTVRMSRRLGLRRQSKRANQSHVGNGHPRQA